MYKQLFRLLAIPVIGLCSHMGEHKLYRPGRLALRAGLLGLAQAGPDGQLVEG